MEKINDRKINGHILRARAIHVEYNEKNTKYFADLERKKAEKKCITKLRVNNEIIDGKENIQKHK